MIGALWNGVAGIWQHDRSINVESNNLANSSTLGHKKDEITFSDLLYTSMGHGKGVTTQSISKSFTQGQIVGTGVGIDVALEGKGFLVVKSRENDGIYYTRAGNFVQAKDGFLETQDSLKVQGVIPQNRVVTTTDTTDTQFTSEYVRNIVSDNVNNGAATIFNINARTTDYVSSSKDDDIVLKGDGYKTAQAKINDINLLQNEYANLLRTFITTPQTQEVEPTSHIASVDFSNSFNSLKDTDNKLVVDVNNRTYSITFDLKKALSQEEIENLYDFLDEDGREKYSLTNPSEILTQTQLDDMLLAIPDQAVIDAMPTTTQAEIDAKAQAQAQKDLAQQEYINAVNSRNVALENYKKAASIVEANINLADKISSSGGLTASAKDGSLKIENLILGKEINFGEIRLNENIVLKTDIQEAQKGSGFATIYAARDALKTAIERADGKFLEITNELNYGDLSTVAQNDINIRLDILGLVDKSVSEVEISNDGFVFVTNNSNKFLVGRLSTAGFRNEQGLNPAGGNLFERTELSGVAFNADTMNTIREKSLERANIDYASTLSHLMVYQKGFEASSKSITTSDEFLKTAIDLVR